MAATEARFEKFSQSARRVLSLAQAEAYRTNHNYIGTEHILLGLVQEAVGVTEEVAARVLFNLGVDLSKVQSAVEFIIGRGEKPVQGEIGFTPRAKHVVELTIDEARRMNHAYIETEHLLIGLVREGEGVAAGVLESVGVTVDKVRAETHRILSRLEPPASEAERDLVSLAEQLVALQEQQEKIERQIGEIKAIQQDLPALEDQLEMKRQEVKEMIKKLAALLATREPQ